MRTIFLGITHKIGPMDRSSQKILADNLIALMRSSGLSARQVSGLAKGAVSDRYIGSIRNRTTNASVEYIDIVAAVFGMEGWQLLVPGMGERPELAARISTLFETYLTAPEEVRQYIDHIAQRDAPRPPDKPHRPLGRVQVMDGSKSAEERNKKAGKK